MSAIGWLLEKGVTFSRSDEARFLILAAQAYRGDPFAAAEAARMLATKTGQIIDKIEKAHNAR